MPDTNNTKDPAAPYGRKPDGTPRAKPGWKAGHSRKRGPDTGPSLTEAAADAARREAPPAQPAAAASPKANGPCATCGQGDGNKACADCGREVSPLTPEACKVLAQNYAVLVVMMASAIGGEGWSPDPRAVAALTANAEQAAWVYRTYLSDKLVLAGVLGATAGVVVPAALHRRKIAQAAKPNGAAAEKKTAAEPPSMGVPG